MDGGGCLLCEVDFPIRCDLLKHLNIYMEICQHGKKNIMSIHRNWPNLVPVLKIWRKKYPNANPVCGCNWFGWVDILIVMLKLAP